MQITTTYKTNSKGTGQIVARGFGKQATINVDQEISLGTNHGNAAATLLLKNGGTSRMFHPSNSLRAEVDNVTGVFKFKTII